ncbi:MAG TPA: amidohydrolase [Jatrophihabitans sp.]|jgi:amidohydrolase
MNDALNLLQASEQWLADNSDRLIEWRRDLHRHPEVAFAEHRTTDRILEILTGLGLSPRRMSAGTGVLCDLEAGIASGDSGATGYRPDVIALRADIDALPLPDAKDVPYASATPGVCHACGHDAHTAILLGVASVLAGVASLPRPVRLIFQPAEERMPGGAEAAVSEGALTDVAGIYALHCDPKLDAGMVGLRAGAITAAFHQIDLYVDGPGGHTARPHLTSDVVYALGKLITELPGLLSRRVDPRSALSLVWGAVTAGAAANAIPPTGQLRGTLRMLDGDLWHHLEDIVGELVDQIVAPTGAKVRMMYDRGMPAVTNDPALVAAQTQAAVRALGAQAVAEATQSMGGEDFAWYLQTVPGSMARLGVGTPGTTSGDLHQSYFDIDESALAVGVRFTAALLDEAFRPTGGEPPASDHPGSAER